MNSTPARIHIAITGSGAITCNGVGSSALLENALAGTTGIQNGLGAVSGQARESILTRYPEMEKETPAVAFAFSSIRQAMREAGWTTLTPSDGFILATTTGQISRWEPGLLRFLREEETAAHFSPAFGGQSLGLTLSRLGTHLGLKGPTLLTTSACSAATQAIAIAAAWIQSGKVKRCLVGGAEVLSELTVEGFRSLQLLSSLPCTPFDVNRTGINLSEGAGFLCLEGVEQATPRALAYLTGYGFSTDAYHLASPHPEGEGSVRAMVSALKRANLFPEEITWVCAHGTGSKANDLAEGAAVRTVFGNYEPWVSSTKHLHGHALGASGAIETILGIEAMKKGVVLKTAGLCVPDPLIRIRHPEKNISMPIHHILKNTLGFGGNNATLILSRVPRKGVET